jgi:hypothetical protein
MAAASRAQTIVIAQPTKRKSNVRRFGRRAGRAIRKGAGFSAAKLREKGNTQTFALGGLTALAFGYLQSKVKLPGIEGVPNSLVYGAGGAAVGVIAKSDKLLKMSFGPLCAGLHNIGLKGIKNGEQIAGEFDSTEGEWDSTAGDEEVTAGEFDDL